MPHPTPALRIETLYQLQNSYVKAHQGLVSSVCQRLIYNSSKRAHAHAREGKSHGREVGKANNSR